MRTLALLAACLGLLAGPPAPAGAEEPPPLLALSGRTIAAITLEGADLAPSELLELIPLRAGQPLSPGLLRACLQRLHRSGRFDRVEALAGEAAGGVHLRFVLTPRRFVTRVVFRGNMRVSDGDLLRMVDVRRGERLEADRVEASRAKLERYYLYRGFSGARVSAVQSILPDGRAVLAFDVREGAASVVTDVRLEGETGLSRWAFLSTVATMPGDRLDGLELDRDLARLASRLKAEGHYFPTVGVAVRDGADGKEVVFSAEPGPRYRLFASDTGPKGEADVLGILRESFQRSTSPREALDDAEGKVREALLRQGYPFVAVERVERDADGEREVGLAVTTGWRVENGTVVVEGALAMGSEWALRVLDLPPGAPFVRRRLDEAIQRLEREYRRQGYESVAVRLQPLGFAEREGEGAHTAHVRLAVSEGAQAILGAVSVEGGPFEPAETLRTLGLSEGGPYSAEGVRDGRERLLSRLADDGYLYAAVEVAEARPEPQRVDLTVRVSEGPRVRLGSVILTGNDRLKPEIARRALDIPREQILNERALLEGQERLYGLRVLQAADVRLADPDVPASEKDLLVQVSERPRYVLGARLGYGSEDRMRAELSFTDRNLGGLARSLSFRARGSAIERLVSAAYTHPWFLGRRMDFSASVSDQVEERESYSRDAPSVAADISRRLSDRTTARLGYTFEGLRLFDVSPGAQLSPDDQGRTDLAFLGFEILYDGRDDFLDPSRGFLGDALLEVADKGIGSEAEYVRTELALRRYLPLGRSLVAAGMVRVGAVRSLGESQEVIINKRFFLGGQNTVRGYSLDGLGPKDAGGKPVGGSAMANANLELRFPLYRSVRGVVFLDSGGLWLDRQTVSQEGYRLSAGMGLRWTSPIGPLSLDYGHKLNPAASDEEDPYRVHFTIGHAF